ncbi:MAG: hypothetical protein KIT41_14260 [Pyrinomonadaceae bacterium]|nr:hypothetical protein [Pyrinomonadaceae bacterium]
MHLNVDIASAASENAGTFERAARIFLEGAAFVSLQHLIDFPRTPKLYESGVIYRHEDTSTIRDLAGTMKRGWGSCGHLCVWRVAELRRDGEQAAFRIFVAHDSAGLRIYHVQVRRGDGSIEDPSRILGMKG